MLNDYEIVRVEKNNVLLSILKLVVAAIVLQICIIFIPQVIGSVEEAQANVQDESYKVRVVANSNTKSDQAIKKEIALAYAPYFSKLMDNGHVDNKQLQQIKQQFEVELKEKYPQIDTEVQIGDNLIPPKRTVGVFYPQNYYQSIFIKIGEGRGDNWWCSAFPSICEPEKEEESEPVTFWLWEWLKDVIEEIKDKF
ncbi:MAG: stage II sporulation protein R [Lysinibacillus sp.]